ncbi:MAG TPA: hypothetical protein PK257_01665 [Candidatus Woesebacteria bacterium]|nr:hypothetical protein [Candidatus Woesebacteria bacterium]
MSEKQLPFIDSIKRIFHNKEKVPNKEEVDFKIQSIRNMYEKFYDLDYSDKLPQEEDLIISDMSPASNEFLLKELNVSLSDKIGNSYTKIPYLRAYYRGLDKKQRLTFLNISMLSDIPQDKEKHDYKICDQIITVDNQKIYDSLDRSVNGYENKIIELANRYFINSGVMNGVDMLFGSIPRQISIYPIDYIKNQLFERFEFKKN